ncbi:MAG: type II secretion system major pseudopilin GspG [Planctomycetia bacterium]|nr:type II secretion system major pseudopilin GspG [Planctomycetia bacterium]MBE7456527.1 type II secretion system major pseudopilin GspG [Planctomycetia bacterium]
MRNAESAIGSPGLGYKHSPRVCDRPARRRAPFIPHSSFRIQHSRRRAFTLVELMVVVVILGILATIVTVSVNDYLVKGKQTAAKAEIARISEALNLFYLDHDRYPDNDEGLAALKQTTPQHPQGILQGDLLDPWGRLYVYVYPGVHGVFDLLSLGADGQEGGTGADTDVVSWEESKP